MPVVDQQFSIRDLEQFSGVKAHTIRMWEQRYALLTPQRTSTNIRYYTGEDLKKLLCVSLLLEHGHKISSVAQLGPTKLADSVGTLAAENDPAARDALLKVAMLQFDEVAFRHVVGQSEEAMGFDRTATEVLLPFLSGIGRLWLSDAICPAHEHFVSHLVREYFIAHAASLPPGSGQTLVLYLPEREIHDIGLLYLHALAKSRGQHSIYLGASVPMEDLAEVARTFPGATFVASCTAFPLPDGAGDYVTAISRTLPEGHRVFLSGRMFDGIEAPDGVCLLPNGHALTQALFQ
jgi:DNA-binding transcriptional MerR regulator